MVGNALLPLVFLLPLAAFGAIAPLTRLWGRRSALIATWAIAASTALALYLFAGGYADHHFENPATWALTNWLPLGAGSYDLGLQVDGMTAMTLLAVTIVSLMVHIYSLGYMGSGTDHEEPNMPRYYGYLAIFTAAMIAMVLADNLLLIFLGWELMGLASYLLIGFWFDKDSAAQAAKKAFLTTKVGDVSLMLGILTLFAATGTFTVSGIAEWVANHEMSGLVIGGALLVFGGAMGKSAQFFLHVWLPDAMEGPTPASSLIHAATMVAAGVYLVARFHFLYAASSHGATVIHPAGAVVAVVGAFTALFAAVVAVGQWDIKRVLAYSTISQLGYMMAGLGAGSAGAGMFHLFTHAFFKALLFMAAGSVIHGAHSNDMREMGGLRKYMPQTFWVFLIGTLALAGIPPLSGFWSKDEILLTAHYAAGHGAPFGWWPYVMLALAAGLTAFYMFRVVLLTFFGEYRGHGTPHESPKSMTMPMWVLAALCVVPVAMSIPSAAGGNLAVHLIDPNGAHHSFSPLVAISSTLIALAGIYVAYLMFFKKSIHPDTIERRWPRLWRALGDRLYIDEALQYLFVRPGAAVSSFLGVFDKRVIDGLVNFVGWLGTAAANFSGWFDAHVVDGLVNLTGWVVDLGGRGARRLQWGTTTAYFLTVLTGLGLYMAWVADPDRGIVFWAAILVIVVVGAAVGLGRWLSRRTVP